MRGWRPRTTRCAALACLTLAACAVEAAGQESPGERSFLWKVSREGSGAVYLAGSVHMLSPAYYPLSAAFDTAFADADLLVEEVDYGEMMARDAQLRMLTRGLLPPGETLQSVLSPATYAVVADRLAALGLPVAGLERFKPWFLALTLLGMEWQQAGFDPRLGLDRHFYDRAIAAGTPVQGLETVDYQISRFDEMTTEDQDRLLAATVRELQTQKASVDEIAQAWRRGDAVTLERLVLQDMRSDPRVYERLLVERNRSWLPILESLVARPGRALVVVGAAHLVGPDGLITALRARGYAVEQM